VPVRRARVRSIASVLVCAALAAAPPSAARAVALPYGRTAVNIGGRSLPAIVVRAPLSHYRLGVALAGSRVGDNAWLESIAQSSRAACAINGTFFAAYAGETREPYGTLVVNGRLLHLGDFGTRLDIYDDGGIRMVREHLQLRGSLDGSESYPNNWYAYNINQTPTASTGAFIYTRERGARLGFRADLAVTARGGRIAAIEQHRDAAIPDDGFIVALMGREVDVLGWKFRVGRSIDYRAAEDGHTLRTRFSLGAGPRLVDHGAVVSDAAAEGFHDPKILEFHGTRSIVGLTEAHEVLLAVVSGATIPEAARAARGLGAWDAMNLDDNASSSLICGGTYLARPGRAVANALVLWPATAP
jgi:Phosphodiester glycosidase